MKIRALKDAYCNGVFLKPGEEHDAPDEDGQFLIDIGKAELVEGESRDDSGPMKVEEKPRPSRKKASVKKKQDADSGK